jgi:LEA14-like dessication related protein
MKLKPLEIAGLVFGGLFLASRLGGYLANKISIGQIKMKLLNVTPLGASIRLFIPVNNLSQVSYPFDQFQGNLFYGTYNLGGLFIPGPAVIPANGATTITTDIEIPFANLASQMVAMIVNGEWLNSISVKGTLTASGIRIPINQPITLL